MNTLLKPILAGSLSLIFIPLALSAPIAVTNGSFEVAPSGGLPNSAGCTGLGCSFSVGVGAIPGWRNSGASGEAIFGIQVGNHFAFDTIPDGIAVAYSNGPIISQTVGALVQQGVTYTLHVDLGVRHDVPNFSASADLLVNGTKYHSVGSIPTPGNWSTFTSTYVGLAADVGKSITIELGSAVNTFPPQADFDNVRLNTDVPAVPEPMSSHMLAAGLVGLLFFRGIKQHGREHDGA